MTTQSTITPRSIRVLLLTLALALAATFGGATTEVAADVLTPTEDAGAPGGGGGFGDAGDTFGQTTNTRSIQMAEDKLAPGGRLADWSDVEAAEAGDGELALTPHTRSILMEENKLSPGGRLADWSDVEAALAASEEVASQPNSPHITDY